MKSGLKIALILLLICAGIIFFYPENKQVSTEPESTIESDTLATEKFISKLNEPWRDFLCERDIYQDFHPDNSLSYNELVEVRGELVHIVSLRGDEDLLGFFTHVDSFHNLEALDIVNAHLSEDRFEQLIAHLQEKEHFKKLLLTNCDIRTLPTSIIKLDSLRSLGLSMNGIKYLPDEMGQLSQLRHLRLYNNRSLRALPTTIGSLKKLKHLDFAGTKITQLPSSIGECTSLIHITGNACRLTSIPPEIGRCQNLRYINLAVNKIKHIPPEIGQLHQLKNLSLGNNRISQLPESFSQLKKLEFCGLGHNQFTKFPTQVLELHNVYSLWLHENDFKNIPAELANLKSLTHLLVDEAEILVSDISQLKKINPQLRIIDED